MTKNNQEKTAVEIIIVVPRNQFNLMYKINDGAEHIIRRDDAFDFFKQYIEHTKYATLKLNLDKFLPFVILPQTGSIQVLKKKKNDFEYHRNKLYNEIESVAKSFRKEPEMSYEQQLEDIIKRFIEIDKKDSAKN